MNKIGERLFNGIIRENPTFVLALGMCPTLAVTTSAVNGLGMGLSTAVVLALSNAIISALRKIIPDKVRIPAFIVVIASFVTMVQLLIQGFLPSLYSSLGIYIPLIVVNCIILGRAEAYASKNPVIPSLFDGIGMGLGFTLALTIIGAIRELLGSGAVFGTRVMPESFTPIGIFVMAPGAFFVLAILTAGQNAIKAHYEKLGKKSKIINVDKLGTGCGSDCSTCGEAGCSMRTSEKAVEEEPIVKEEVKAPETPKEETAPVEVVEEAPKKRGPGRPKKNPEEKAEEKASPKKSTKKEETSEPSEKPKRKPGRPKKVAEPVEEPKEEIEDDLVFIDLDKEDE